MRRIELYVRHLWAISLILILIGCDRSKEKPVDSGNELEERVLVPSFNADSAYQFVKRQVDFGPRVPDSESHKKAGDFFVERFKSFGGKVAEQHFEATTFDGRRVMLRNIIASFQPEKQKRILLAAHWDTRPFADKDPDKRDSPFDGANDGASGVGVLLEIARQLNQSPPGNVGVDIILFDGEDWGEKENDDKNHQLPAGLKSWWCLGSQYWAKNPHTSNYSAYFGILLDMVGAKNAKFFKEGVSVEYASQTVNKVWATASRLGYSSVFINQNVGSTMDDHVFVNEVAKIPMISIVDYQPGVGYFGDYHHSQKDNLSLIGKETLGIVGNTVLHVIYHE